MSHILAIDLGKYNSVLCGFDPQSGEVEFGTVKTTPAVLRGEFTRRPDRRNGEVSGTHGDITVSPSIPRGVAGADPGEVFGTAAA